MKNLFAINPIVANVEQNAKFLQNWVDIYDWDNIKSELDILSTRNKTSKDEILKFLSNSVRLEFLTALAIKSKLPEVRVIPNYPCDDEGLPISTASGIGSQGDIECFEQSNAILVEVTMAEGASTNHDGSLANQSTFRGFLKINILQNSQCVFIAPSIFRDSERQINWIKSEENLVIRPYKINDFISYLEVENQLYV